ncbi:MAG: glycine cleavage T C-terminal barrel domain-containing protein [Kiloniellales bacterium]
MSHRIGIGPNLRQSPYYQATIEAGVESFSVYNHMLIPGSFGDPEAEYRRLIEGVAQWDVAAQRQVEVAGKDASRLLQYLTTRDVRGTAVGQGRYVPLCNHQGQLINDPVLLKLEEERYWLSLADADVALWAEATARALNYEVEIFEPDASPMAIQGPKAVDLAADLFGSWVRELKYFWFRETELAGIPLVLARSGWSKQGGFELYLTDKSRGGELWRLVREAGQAYGIGPGAPNDLERLESGLLSYGADARVQTHPANPFELGLGKLVDLDGEPFIGREALQRIKAQGITRRRVGFFIDGPPLSPNQAALEIRSKGRPAGYVSELAYSRRLGRNIAVGMVALDAEALTLVVEGEARGLSVTTLPFIKAA